MDESIDFVLRNIPPTETDFGVYDIVTSPHFLAHFNGADGSTTLIDATGRHLITANGNAQISTAQSVFGGASLRVTGNDPANSAQVDGGTDLAFGTGDFTVDFRLMLATDLGGQGYFDFRTAAGQNAISCRQTDLSQPLQIVGGVGGATVLSQTNAPLSTGVFYHIAITRASGILRLFQDGVKTATGDVADATSYTCDGGRPYIGRLSTIFGADCWIDEFRIISNYAAWTSDFSVPSQPYSPP